MFIKKLKTFIIISLALFCFKLNGREPIKPPKLTVVLIVDQFAYNYFPKLQKHFKHGLRFLLDNGIVYTNAYFPHGVPETAPGHNTFNTGCLPKDHGATTNSWLNEKGQNIRYAGTHDSSLTMIDGLTEQFMQQTDDDDSNKVFALSIKDHAAISVANKQGKAIWFNSQQGNFESSPAYFEKLPNWVNEFNNKKGLSRLESIEWNSAYPLNSKCYKFPFINNYDFCAYKSSFVRKHKILINHLQKKPYDLFIKTPYANQMLFDLAQTCIQFNLDKSPKGKTLLWICLSPLDYLVHFFGPDSLEAIDMIYHLDRQIGVFLNYLNKKIGRGNYLLVLSGDHGVAPIPEIMQKQHIKIAKRIDSIELIKKMNQHLNDAIKLKHKGSKTMSGDFVKAYEPPSFFLNKEKINRLNENERQIVLKILTDFLRDTPGIKTVWTYDELEKSVFEPHQLENFYKTQLYRNRVGEIICHPEPYCQITEYKTGTTHMTPYSYDTHVPLIFYQHRNFQSKTIHSRVWIPQVAASIARIHNISKPSASIYEPLPELFSKEN